MISRKFFWKGPKINTGILILSSFVQYYYAHNTLNFSTEGAKHFEGDGKIYGGDPVLIKTQSLIEREQKLGQIAAEAKQKTCKISKHSWCDEESKVKIYIDTNQFKGEILESMVEVKFDEYLCDIKVVDEEGTCHILNLYK